MAPGPAIPPPSRGELTRLLQAWSRGDAGAQDRLLPIVYHELHRRAIAYLRRERRDHTLKPTDLVHEAYLRLCSQDVAWQNREQFFGVAARLMRRILVDHARARTTAKRQHGLRVPLGEDLAARPPLAPDLLDLDPMLDHRLRLARVVTLVDRGLQQAQTLSADPAVQAELYETLGGIYQKLGNLTRADSLLGVSLATANREWAMAKAWLYRRLKSLDEARGEAG